MREEKTLGFVYYLQNPKTMEIFYVGVTQSSLTNRLRTHYQHLREFERGLRKDNRRYQYLKDLRPFKATIHLLEIVHGPLKKLEEREKVYISFFKKQNPNLTNMTNGGRGGCTNCFYTEQEMENLSLKHSNSLKGKSKPKGFAENLSIKRKGFGNPATKELKNWIVAKKEEDYYLFKYGFQINDFLDNKYAYRNVIRFIDSETNKPYGYFWKNFHNLSKGIQDIVQTTYESK